MIDQFQMATMIELLKSNPDQAAAIMAQTGLTPEQVMSSGSPELGALIPPQVSASSGILSQPPSLASAGFTPGPAVNPANSAGMNSFTPADAGGWRDPATPPVPFSTAELPPLPPDALPGVKVPGRPDPLPPPMALGGPGVGQGQLGVGNMDVAGMAGGGVDPMMNPAAAGGFDAAGFAKLLAGAGKGMSASSDVKPVFSGGVTGSQKAPELSTQVGGKAPVSTQALLQLLMAGQNQPRPMMTLGSLIGRG